MPIDSSNWGAPAKRGDIAGVYLDISLMARLLRGIAEKIADKVDVDLSEEIEELKKTDDNAFEYFKELSGWSHQ